MPYRTDYPYDEALDDLRAFVKAHIKNDARQREILDYLDECRKAKTVTFRYIHEEIMKYRKEFSDYSGFSEEERQMIDDLFHFWG